MIDKIIEYYNKNPDAKAFWERVKECQVGLDIEHALSEGDFDAHVDVRLIEFAGELTPASDESTPRGEEWMKPIQSREWVEEHLNPFTCEGNTDLSSLAPETIEGLRHLCWIHDSAHNMVRLLWSAIQLVATPEDKKILNDLPTRQ